MLEILPDWHAQNFAEIAWTAFAALSLFVFAWNRLEPRLRTFVATTPTRDDDAAVEVVSGFVRSMSSFVDVISFVVPRALTRGRITGAPPAPQPEPELHPEPTVPVKRTRSKQITDKAPPPKARRPKAQKPQKKPAKGQD